MSGSLDYLDFEYSEDEHGIGTFDAMASVLPAHVQALHAELTQVLSWAFLAFPEGQGPLNEGFEWDYDLQLADMTGEGSGPGDAIGFDETTSRLWVRTSRDVAPNARHTVTLTLSGTPVFCDALRKKYLLD